MESFWAKITYRKSFKSLGLWSPNRYEIDLLNEVLNIDFDWGAARISEEIFANQLSSIPCAGGRPSSRFFIHLQIWPLISLQPLDQNQCLVPHLKDLFHICLETKVQGFWMTFKVCNHGSKYLYLLHKMGFVDSQFGITVFWTGQWELTYFPTYDQM